MFIFWLGVLDKDVENKVEFLRSQKYSVQHYENKHEFLDAVETTLSDSPNQQVLAMMNFYSTSMAINLCGTIRSFTARYPVLIMLNVENASIEDRENFFSEGGDDLIVGSCGKLELFSKIAIHDTFFAQMEKNKFEMEQASQMTLLAMENSSDLGNILDFTRSVLGKHDYKVIADAIFNVTRQFSQQSFVEIIGLNDIHSFSASGTSETFKKIADSDRVVHRDNILQINQEFIFVQLAELNEYNAIKLGRISDNMSTLVEMANRFVKHVNTEKKALQIEKLRLDFIGSMINELLTRMKVIQKFSGSMKKVPAGSPLGEKHIAALKSAHESVMKINQIILTMIDINQLKSEENYLNSDEVNVKKLLESLTESYAPIAKSRNQNNFYLSKNEEYSFETNKKFLTNILCHLLDNAIKFTKNGSITIGVDIENSSEQNKVTFFISDTGSGLPEDEVKKLQSRSSRPKQEINKNPGLGLTYVKLFSELIGFEIQVSSSPNSGTRFSLSHVERQKTASVQTEDVGGAELF